MTAETAVAASPPRALNETDRLADVFDAHHQRLYRLARRLTPIADDARELVQETFLRAARSPHSVPHGLAHEEAWLVRVLVNLARDRWRQRQRRERIDLSDVVPAESASNPESAAVAHSVVWHALDALAPQRRAVLVMYELEGTPIDVIARTLGIAAVTVRWHLARGRRQLAAIISATGSVS